jgi:hypothetical protein
MLGSHLWHITHNIVVMTCMQVELGLTVFAARAQGHGEGVIEDLLVGAVQASLSAALTRATTVAAARQGSCVHCLCTLHSSLYNMLRPALVGCVQSHAGCCSVYLCVCSSP